jgi:hypothetical protein
MAVLGVGQAAAYRRVAACIERGLLERLDLLRAEPSLLRATRSGLRYAGLGLPVAIVSPGAVDHWLRCAGTAQLLAAEFGAERILTERELRLLERLEGRPIASAKLGELPSGHPRLHRPDLVVLPAGHPLVRFHQEGGAPSSAAPDGNQVRRTGEDDEAFSSLAADPRTRGAGSTTDGSSGSRRPSSPRTQEGWQGERTDSCVTRRHPTEDTGMRSVSAGLIAVEVELTPKAPQRLLQIIRAWRGADWVAEVRYHCAPGATRRGVEKAVAKTYAADRIRVSGAVAR